MLLLAWQSIVVNRQIRLFYIPSEDNTGDLPTRPERISVNAPNNVLPLSKRVDQAHVRKLLRHSISKIQKVTRHHAPHLAHKLPEFLIQWNMYCKIFFTALLQQLTVTGYLHLT